MYDITVALAVFVSPVQYYCEAYGVFTLDTKQSFASLLSLMRAYVYLASGYRVIPEVIDKMWKKSGTFFLNYKFRMLMKLHFIIMSL